MEVWLIRHGTTKANQEGRLQGQQEYPLAQKGRLEINELAGFLQGTQLDAVLTSPLGRASETAKAILQARKNDKLEQVEINLLKEYGWGCLEGFTWEELRQAYPDFYHRLKQDFWGTPVPGREEINEFLNRVKDSLHYIYSRYHGCRRVLLVSHGRFINAFITCSLGLDLKGKWPFSPYPASLSALDLSFSRDKIKLILFNEHCYLSKTGNRTR